MEAYLSHCIFLTSGQDGSPPPSSSRLPLGKSEQANINVSFLFFLFFARRYINTDDKLIRFQLTLCTRFTCD